MTDRLTLWLLLCLFGYLLTCALIAHTLDPPAPPVIAHPAPDVF